MPGAALRPMNSEADRGLCLCPRARACPAIEVDACEMKVTATSAEMEVHWNNILEKECDV